MGKRIHYLLYRGIKTKNISSMSYSFSNTSNIQISVSRRSFSIEVEQTVLKNPSEILTSALFRDAIKKAVLIQMIKYNQISEGDLYVEINGENYCIYEDNADSQEQLLYSMCGKKLLRKMADNWTEASIQRLLNTTKSKADRLDAALDAFLISKSKKYETERFVYLWMVMNGLYGFVGEEASEYINDKNTKKWLSRDVGQIKFFAMLLNYQYRGRFKDNGKMITKKLELLLAKLTDEPMEQIVKAVKRDDCTCDFVKNMHSIFVEEGCEDGKMHPYMALLLFLPYKMRCRYFHAERPVAMICFENEHPIPVLKILNAFIEDFLDSCLSRWFDKKDLEDNIKPTIRLIVQSCKCDKSGQLISCMIEGEDKV